MRARSQRLAPLILGLLVAGGCASASPLIAVRRVSPPEWVAVVECVTLAARASGKEVVVSDFAVSIPTPVKRGWGSEDIQFLWGPTSTVLSKISVRDLRQGNRVPMEGASQEIRRLHRQLDQQCLQAYPVAVRVGASQSDVRRSGGD